MLLVVADQYLQQKKEPEKVHAYSAKIVEIMGHEAEAGGHERRRLDGAQEPDHAGWRIT